MSEQTPETAENQILRIVTGLFAIAALWSWSYLCFFSSVVLLPFDADLLIEPLFRIICFFCLAATLLCFVLCQRFLKSKFFLKFLYALAFVCAPWAPLFTLFCKTYTNQTPLIGCICWGLTGISMALMMIFTCRCSFGKSLRTMLLYMGASITIGAFIYLCASVSNRTMGLCIAIILPYAALLFQLFGGFIKEFCVLVHNTERVPLKLQIIDSLSFNRSYLLNGILFGFGIGVALSVLSLDNIQNWRALLACCVCVSGPMTLLCYCFKKTTFIDALRWMQTAICASCLLPLVLGVNVITIISCCALYVAYLIFDVMHIVHIHELASDEINQGPLIFAGCKFYMYLGIAIGWTIMYAILKLTGFASVLFYAAIIIIVIVCLFGIAITGYPKRREFIEAVTHSTKPTGNFKSIMTQLSTEAGLTERQSVVFEYLAKGRNTAFISETLFLSTHTVKAHMYRIYQKLGVHTQQELINLVEEELKKQRSDY